MTLVDVSLQVSRDDYLELRDLLTEQILRCGEYIELDCAERLLKALKVEVAASK